MTWQPGTSGNPGGKPKSHTKKGQPGYTSLLPSEKCEVCGVIIRKHPRCPECDILVGDGHYQSRACSGDFDIHPDAVFWVLAAMIENVKRDLRSAREHKRALAYVQSDDWAQWAEAIGVSASDARDALLGVAQDADSGLVAALAVVSGR